MRLNMHSLNWGEEIKVKLETMAMIIEDNLVHISILTFNWY